MLLICCFQSITNRDTQEGANKLLDFILNNLIYIKTEAFKFF